MTEFKYSNKKILFIIYLMAMILVVWFLISRINFFPNILKDILLVSAYILGVLTLIGDVYLVLMLMEKKALTITNDGQLNFGKALGGYKISIDQVDHTELVIQKGNYINLCFRIDNEKVWLRNQNAWGKINALINKAVLGYIVYIPVYLMKDNAETILEKITPHHNA